MDEARHKMTNIRTNTDHQQVEMIHKTDASTTCVIQIKGITTEYTSQWITSYGIRHYCMLSCWKCEVYSDVTSNLASQITQNNPKITTTIYYH